MRRVVSFLLVVVGLAVAATASAAPKKKAATCTSPLSCARACSVKNGAACDRLADHLLDELLAREIRGSGKQDWISGEVTAAARRSLPPVCVAGGDRSCLLLGKLEEIGLGGAADPAAAERRFSDACNRGHGASCYALGVGMAMDRFGEAEPAAFAKTLERSCARGFAGGCALSGLAVVLGARGEPEQDGGKSMMVDACEKKRDSLACMWLGASFADTTFGAEEPARAIATFALACELGSPSGCAAAAGMSPDRARARQYQEKACANGDGPTCDLLALSSSGDAEAVSLHEQGCQRYHARSCMWLAAAHRDGNRGLIRDLKRARAYATLACDVGSNGCAQAALLELEDPARRDAAIASAIALCDGGNAAACRQLAVRFQAGDRLAGPDLARALALYRSECALTGDVQCADAEGVAREIARLANAAGCTSGDVAACERFIAGDDTGPAWLSVLESACKAEVRGACLKRDQSAFMDYEDQAHLTSSIVACDAGDVDACGFVVTFSEDDAVKLAAQTGLCRGDVADACHQMADTAYDADDKPRALELSRKACKLDADSESCGRIDELEAAIAQERSVEQAEAEAAACEGGDVAACTVVGHRAGSTEYALYMWDHACAKRDPHACYHSGVLRAEEYPDDARRDLTIACKGGGHENACSALAALPAPESESSVEVAAAPLAVDASTYASAPSPDRGERISARSVAEVRLGHYSFDVPSDRMLPGRSGLHLVTAFAPGVGRRVAVFAPMTSVLSIGGDGDIGVDTGGGVGLELRGRRVAVGASAVGGYSLVSSETATSAGVDSSAYVGGELRSRVSAGKLGLSGRAMSLARGDLNEIRLEGVLEYRGRERIFGLGATFTEYGDRLSSTAFFFAVSR